MSEYTSGFVETPTPLEDYFTIDSQEGNNCNEHQLISPRDQLENKQGKCDRTVPTKPGYIHIQHMDEMPCKNQLEENDFDADTILSILCEPHTSHTNQLLSNYVQGAPCSYKLRLRRLSETGNLLPTCNHNLFGESIAPSNLFKSSFEGAHEAEDPLAVPLPSNNSDYLKATVISQESQKKLVPVIQSLKDKSTNTQVIFNSCFDLKKLGNSNESTKQLLKATPKRHVKKKKKSVTRGKKHVRLLMKELSIVTNCRSKIDAITLRKVTNTIKCLQNRSTELINTYSKLMILNQDLLRQKSLLLSALNYGVYRTAPFVRESFILPDTFNYTFEERLATRGDDLSEISSKSSGLDEFRDSFEEIYEHKYDSQSPYRLIHTESSSCGQTFCRLGCVCDSLNAGVPLLDHCQIPACMFECSCSESDEENSALACDSPAKPTISSNSKAKSTSNTLHPKEIELCTETSSQPVYLQFEHGKLSVLKSDSYLCDAAGRIRSKTKKGKLLKGNIISTTKVTLSDSKLFKQCYVRLKKMNLCCQPSIQEKSNNQKLFLKAYIPLIRAKICPTHRVYCMNHCQYECSCLKLKRNLN